MRRLIWVGCLSCLGCLGVSAALAAPPDRGPYPTLPQLPAANSTPTVPPVLKQPSEPSPSEGFAPAEPAVVDYPIFAPLGFTGQSRIQVIDEASDDFIPLPDRWRLGFPPWDRYEKGHPLENEYPFVTGSPLDPYHQNVLKGDYPIYGQHTFLNVTARSFTVVDANQVPTNATGFESTARPFQTDFFGSPNHLAVNEFLSLSLDLFHGDAAFKPMDWRVKVTPVFNVNTLNVDELGVVNTNVTKGTQRDRTFFSLEEYFAEVKLADISPDFDFVSLRGGSQFFNNDFRGFLFSDTNRAVRLFGTYAANRDQFNVIYFRPAEKDTNSGLNTFTDRDQNILFANYFHQDFIFPGYTVEASVAYNHDAASFHFDRNNFLVRPDPVGTFTPQREDVVYLGLGTDGHINCVNVTSQFYYAFGQEGHNNLSGQQVDISAWMAAVELSYDRDWTRFRTSFLYSSGDHNTFNSHATGFDSIFNDPNFAGGEFSFWQRQEIKLLGVDLKNADDLIPNLRSSKIEGQSNFVNPGLLLFNLGVDFELTPKLKMINNCNFLWFEDTKVLEQFVFQNNIGTRIGTDLSTGVEYRPLLTNNVIMTFGVATLIPGSGFKALYDFAGHTVDTMVAGFAELKLTY